MGGDSSKEVKESGSPRTPDQGNTKASTPTATVSTPNAGKSKHENLRKRKRAVF